MMDSVLLMQLPVPEPVLAPVTGLAQMGAADLVLHAKAMGLAVPELVPDRVARRFGDQALVGWLTGRRPAVMGFTLTSWNVERSAWVATRLKEGLPGVQIWIGGPEVAEGSWALKPGNFPFDLAVVGEGEMAMAALLAGMSPDLIPGVMRSGGPLPSRRARPLPSLATVHDPFASGLLSLERDRVVLAEFWRGCRHGCSYCAYGQGRRQGIGRPMPQVEALVRWSAAAGARQLYLLDPSLEQRPDLAELLTELARINRPPIPLLAELRADAVTPELARALARAGLVGAEIGLQTVTTESLKSVGRSFIRKAFREGLRALAANSVRIKVDLIAGLAGDSAQGLSATLDFLDETGSSPRLQLFPLQLLPGTRLRRQAADSGWRFQERPPYQLLSGGGWDEEEMERSVALFEQRTGTLLSGEPCPLLAVPDDGGAWRHRIGCPDSDCVVQLCFDLDSEADRLALTNERFDDLAANVTLWLRSRTPDRQCRLVAEGVARLLSANPFGSLTVAVEQPPGSPLNLLDLLLKLLRAQEEGYLERFHRRPGVSRRLCLLLPGSRRGEVDTDWLADARRLATVVWRLGLADVSQLDDRCRALGLDGELRLVRTAGRLGETEIDQLARCNNSDRVILADLENHFELLLAIARLTGEDW